MKLIVGLGNPGEKYSGVRHNLGFVVLEEFSAKCKVQGAKWEYNKKLKSEIMKLALAFGTNHLSLVFAKPQTFMNNSGQAVKILSDYFKIPPEDITIIHDELDLPLGKIKVRNGGAAAGHHGVESIIAALGSDKFTRVRLGIGNLKTLSAERSGAHVDTNKFVLEPFTSNERSKVKHMVKQAVGALETLLEKGLESAQNQFN